MLGKSGTATQLQEYKPFQLTTAAACGLDVPRTVITNVPGDAGEHSAHLGSSVVYKTLASATVADGQQVSLIYTNTTTDQPVTQGGDRRLWDELETALDLWTRLEQPRPENYTITITPDGQQVVTLPDTDRSWTLPL